MVEGRNQVQSYAIGPSEHRFVTLADGAKISSVPAPNFPALRGEGRVIFFDRGEAWFDVVHNSRRPFTVLAGMGLLRHSERSFTYVEK